MKTIIVLFAIAFCSAVYAQEIKETEVPADIVRHVKEMYPSVKKIQWEKEGKNYEAEFKNAGTELSVLYSADGNLLEIETHISSADLPQAAKEYISKNYMRSNIKEAAKIVTASGLITYEAEVDNKDLIFDVMGNFIRIEEER